MPDHTPEQSARRNIDAMLAASGWMVQAKGQINLAAGLGVAVCELSFKTGEPDYTLFVDGKAIGTVEAKPEGIPLTGVEEQSAKYVAGVPFAIAAWKSPLPFCYESTGAETYFTSRLDPDPRSRRVFYFHRPETLLGPGCSRKNPSLNGSGSFHPCLQPHCGSRKSMLSSTWRNRSPKETVGL